MDIGEEEWIKNALMEYERSKCTSKVLSVKSESAVPNGVNFGSQMIRVKMKVVKKNGEVDDKVMICKALESGRQELKKYGVFQTEIRAYTELFPVFERIMRSKKDSSEDTLWAQCYGTRPDGDALLLEDLSVLGYRIKSKRLGLDLEHTNLVLKSVAKFHALAAVAIENDEIVKRDFSWVYYTNAPDLFCDYIRLLAERIRTHWANDWQRFVEKLNNFADTFTERLRSAFEVDETQFNTLNRGDCWVNNIMFQYGDDGDLRNIKFVDYQVTIYNGPGYDLQHFLNTSTDKSLYDRNTELIRYYTEQLERYLTHYGYKSSVPTFEDVLRSYDRLRVYGLAVALVWRSCMMLPQESNPDGSLLVTFDYDGEDFINGIKKALIEGETNGII